MPRDWHPLFEFYEPRQTPFVPITCSGALPHLYKTDNVMFVCFRLADAVIEDHERAAWGRAKHSAESSQRRRDRSVMRDLVNAATPPLQRGSCLLGMPAVAEIVQNALLHYDVWEVLRRNRPDGPLDLETLPAEARYLLTSWTVMPNHVHVTYLPAAKCSPQTIHQAWKSYTAHAINQMLGRKGTLWQRECFDHVIRSAEQHESTIEYIESNAERAGLCKRREDWPYCSAFPGNQVRR